MKTGLISFGVALFLTPGVFAQGPALDSPVEIVERLKQTQTISAPSDALEEIIGFLDNRRAVQTPSGIPSSPSTEARKLLEANLDTVEVYLPPALPTLSIYGQTRLISILGKGKEPETLLFLRDLLDNSSSSIRNAALDAMVQRNENKPFPLNQWLENGWALQSAEAMKLPGRVLDFGALQYCMEAYAQQGDPEKKASLFWSIAALVDQHPEQAEALFEKTEPVRQRAVLAKGMTQSGRFHGEDFLLGLFEDEETDPLVLSSAIEGLPGFDSPDIRRHLLDAFFFSVHEKIVQASILLMGKSQDPLLAIPLAVRSLTLTELQKESVGRALTELGGPAAEHLCARLLESNQYIARSSLDGLRRMGPVASDSMYESIMWPELDFEFRMQLQNFIERTGRKAPTEEQQVFYRLFAEIDYATEHLFSPWLTLLHTWVDHPIDQIQIAVHKALGVFQDPVSTDLLIEAMKGPDNTLATVAAKGLSGRIHSLSKRIQTDIKYASIPQARQMTDALAGIEFVPHRTKERAVFEARREAWETMNRLPPPAADGILEAFIKSSEAQPLVSLAWAVHHLDPDTPNQLTGTYPGLPQLLPWNSKADQISTVSRLDKIPPLQRRRAIALAACMTDPTITEPVFAYLMDTQDFPLEVLLRLHESRREPLVSFAARALTERNYQDLSPLAEAMVTASKFTAAVLAERLALENYSPKTVEEALIYHDLLGNWPQLIAMGEAGLEKLREDVKSKTGMEAIQRYIGLATAEGRHPVPYLAERVAERPDELFSPLFSFYNDQQDLDFTPTLSAWLKQSGDGASSVLASLLVRLGYQTEDPTERAVLGYALNDPLPVARHAEAGKVFLLDELMQRDPQRLSRASMWSLKHRNFAGGNLSITRTINNPTEIRDILQDDNDLIVFSMLNLLPQLHEKSPRDLEIVETLIPMLDSERVLLTQNGSAPLNVLVAQALIQIGEDAAQPLLDHWQKNFDATNTATQFALMSIPSPKLVNAQKTMLRNRQWLNDAGLVAVINTLSKTKDPTTAKLIYEIALQDRYEVRAAAIEALAHIGEPVIPLLQKTLEFGNPEKEQRIAANILSQIGGDVAEKEFMHTLKQNQPHLRQLAVDFLVESKPPDALPVLTQLLDADGVSPSLAGSLALIRWGEEAIPYLIESLYQGTDRSLKLKFATLIQITGKNPGDTPWDWQQWYRDQNIDLKQ